MSIKDEGKEVGKEIVKKRRGNNGGKSWLSQEAQQVLLEPGDNRKFLCISMELASLPPIDLKDGEAVEQRIIEYFEIHMNHDLKPTVMGLGIALGVDRRRLWEIKTGNAVGGRDKPHDLPRRTVDAVKKAYFLMENQWEQYMLNGKVNPVSGIFLGKNNFGYQDKTEYVLTPNQPKDNDYDADAIRERYKQLPELPKDDS